METTRTQPPRVMLLDSYIDSLCWECTRCPDPSWVFLQIFCMHLVYIAITKYNVVVH